MAAMSHVGNNIATAQIVDACMRTKLPYRMAPAGIQPVTAVPSMISGPVIPARHYGSVDIFLEAIESTKTKNGILVIDNQNRKDEACIGDLVVLESKNAGIQALIVWGLHRDTNDLHQIGLPVLSYGAYPAGPARLDPREPEALLNARFDNFTVTTSDTAFIDSDGVVFIETINVPQVLEIAKTIRESERQQADLAATGRTLRDQFRFRDYLKRRETDEAFTFRQHLTALSKSIEE